MFLNVSRVLTEEINSKHCEAVAVIKLRKELFEEEAASAAQ